MGLTDCKDWLHVFQAFGNVNRMVVKVQGHLKITQTACSVCSSDVSGWYLWGKLHEVHLPVWEDWHCSALCCTVTCRYGKESESSINCIISIIVNNYWVIDVHQGLVEVTVTWPSGSYLLCLHYCNLATAHMLLCLALVSLFHCLLHIQLQVVISWFIYWTCTI